MAGNVPKTPLSADKMLGFVSGGLGLVSTGLGIFQSIKGAQQQREAEKASAKFAADIRQRLLERTVGKQALPMRGFDLAKEAQAQRYATGVAALQSAGAEGVLGGLGGLERQQGQQDLALAAQLEKMEYARDLEYQRRLDRERDLQYQTLTELDLMGLKGAQTKAAESEMRKRQGLESIPQGLGAAAEMYLKHSSLYPKTGTAATGTTLGTGGTNMVNVGGNTSQISPIGPTAANIAGFVGPYNLPQYGPFQPSYNLHNLWDPTTNPFGGPQRPNLFGGPQSQNQWSFQSAGANPYTVPSMNIGSSSWLGGNSYP